MNKDTKTKDKIISAFIDLVYENRSLEDIELKEITDRANVSLSIFFYYFKNKRALLKASLNIIWGKINYAILHRPPYNKRDYYPKDEIEIQEKLRGSRMIPLEYNYIKFLAGWEHLDYYCKLHDIFSIFYGFFLNDKKLTKIIFLGEAEGLYPKEYINFINFIDGLINEGIKYFPLASSIICSDGFRTKLFRNRMLSTGRDILKVLGGLSIFDVDNLLMNYLLSFFDTLYRIDIESCIVNYRIFNKRLHFKNKEDFLETNFLFRNIKNRLQKDFYNQAEHINKVNKLYDMLNETCSGLLEPNSKLKSAMENMQELFPEHKKCIKKVIKSRQ